VHDNIIAALSGRDGKRASDPPPGAGNQRPTAIRHLGAPATRRI